MALIQSQSKMDKDQPYHKAQQADDGFLHPNRCIDVEDDTLLAQLRMLSIRDPLLSQGLSVVRRLCHSTALMIVSKGRFRIGKW